MNKFILACVAVSLACIADRVHAQPCLITMEGEVKGIWQGACPNGIASGTGTAILENATYHGEARDGRAIGTGQLKFRDGTTHECEFGGWEIDCPDVDMDVRADRHASEPADRQLEGRTAAAGAAEDPSTDRFADDRPDSRAAPQRTLSALDTAGAGHGDPVQATEPAVTPDRSLSAEGETRSPGMAATTEPVGLQVPAPTTRCKLEFADVFVDWSGPCENGRASGEGTARSPDGMTYTGSAAQGRPHGFGTVSGPGGYYQGEFSNGLHHGRGIYRDADNKYYKATFKNGFQATDGVPVQGSSGGDDTAGELREASMPSDRDENESASGKNDPWAPEETAEAGSTGLQPGGEPAQDPAADGTAYDRAVARSLGDDIGGIRGATDDSYESKLADVERAEAERRKALEIEANFRRKEREKERRAEVLKAELRKKAEARETERLRRLNERLVHQPTRSRTPVETKRTNWHSLADSLKKSMQNLENRVNQIKKERERQRRAYERQQQLEHHRYERDGWVNSGPWRGRSSGGSSDSRGSIQ